MTLDGAHELKLSKPCVRKCPISNLIPHLCCIHISGSVPVELAPADHKHMQERPLDGHSSNFRRGMYLGATEDERFLYERAGVLHLKHGLLAGKLSHPGLDTRVLVPIGAAG